MTSTGMEPSGTKGKRGRQIRLAAGWVLTVGGVALGFVPVLQGWMLLIPGVAILSAESRWFRSLLRRHRERRYMKQALHQAERAGLKINLDHDPDVDGEEADTRGPGRGSAG